MKDQTPTDHDYLVSSGSNVGKDVNTSGGDFIGRDAIIYGDKIIGNKITINEDIDRTPAKKQSLKLNAPRSTHTNTILTGIITFLGAIVVNLATSTVPTSWQPYLWLS